MALHIKESKETTVTVPKRFVLNGIDLEEGPPEEYVESEVCLDAFSVDEQVVIKKFLHMHESELMEYLPKTKGSKNNSKDPETQLSMQARFVYVYKLKLRGVGDTEIAKRLDISTRMVREVKKKIGLKMKEQVSGMDFGVYAGETVSFYREIRSMSLALFGSKEISPMGKVSCLNTAMKAESELRQFFRECGVFEALGDGNPLTQRAKEQSMEGESTDFQDDLLTLALSLREEYAKSNYEASLEDGDVPSI